MEDGLEDRISELLAQLTDPTTDDEKQLDTSIDRLADLLQKNDTYEVDEPTFEYLLTKLESRLADPNSDVRAQTTEIVGRVIEELMLPSSVHITYQNDRAVNALAPLLATALHDNVPAVRKQAAAELTHTALSDKNSLKAQYTSQTPNYVILDELAQALSKEPNPDIRAKIVRSLYLLAAHERPSEVLEILPTLHTLIKDDDTQTRNKAIETIDHTIGVWRVDTEWIPPRPYLPYHRHQSGNYFEPVISDLIELLDHSDATTRERAAKALQSVAYHYPCLLEPYVFELLQSVTRDDPEVSAQLIILVAYLIRAHPILGVPAVEILTQYRDATDQVRAGQTKDYARAGLYWLQTYYPTAITEASPVTTEELSSINNEIAAELFIENRVARPPSSNAIEWRGKNLSELMEIINAEYTATGTVSWQLGQQLKLAIQTASTHKSSNFKEVVALGEKLRTSENRKAAMLAHELLISGANKYQDQTHQPAAVVDNTVCNLTNTDHQCLQTVPQVTLQLLNEMI